MTAFPEITKSRLRRKLLGFFLTNPASDLYVREAAAILKEDPTNISRELSRLEKMGLFVSRERGKQKYFSLNNNYPLYKELKSVVFKTIGAEGSLRGFVDSTPGINIAFIYGSFAEGKENAASDIDLMVVGTPEKDDFMAKIEALEKRLQREVNYNICSKREFKAKLKEKNSFMSNILKRPKIMLKGRVDGI